MLRDQIREPVRRMLAKTIIQGYQFTSRLTRGLDLLDSPMGRELRPHFRRAVIESLAKRNAVGVDGLTAEVIANSAGNTHYTLLTTDTGVLITINHLPNQINGQEQVTPRPALFRSKLMVSNPDSPDLFPTYPEKYFGEDKIYSTLVHWGREEVDRVSLQVVNPSGDKIVDQLTIPLTGIVDGGDVNRIDGVSQELLEILKKAAGGK